MSPSEIAFWKIVGFDVTPTTASSSIIRASSPVCSRRRERKSIQTLWPSSDSSCRRDLAIGFLPFHLLDLLKPSDVAFPAVEPCNEEGAHQLARQLGPHDLGAEAEHVHVIVLDALVCRVVVVADRGTDAWDLARRDRRADPGAADEHGAFRLTAANCLADLARLVRVVDARRRLVGAKIDD